MGFRNGTGIGINFGDGIRPIGVSAPGLTYACWLDLDNTDAQGIFEISTGDGTLSARLEVAILATGEMTMGGRGSDTDTYKRYTPGYLAEIGLHHCVFINDYTADTASMYIDGVLIGDSDPRSWSSQTDAIPPDYCLMGGHNAPTGQDPTQGGVHDCRVYSRALIESEVKTIFNSRGTDSIIDGLALRYIGLGVSNDAITVTNTKEIGPNQYEPINVNGEVLFESSPLSYRRRKNG